MRFGLKLGTHTPPEGGNHWDVTRQIALTAEEAGFDSVWMNDHFMFKDDADPEKTFPWLECFVSLGAIAEATERVKIGALVAGVPYRNPALFAKMSATLDIISHGRSIIGIGAGWHKVEFDAYGWPFPAVKERMEMLEDAARIIKLMMTERPATFAGKHYSIDGAYNDPPPIQRPHPPIMIAGGGEKRTLRLVAQYGDWCNVFGMVEDVARKFDVLRRHCAEVGRPYDTITRSIDFWCLIGEDAGDVERKRAKHPDFDAYIGTTEETIDVLREYKAAGAQYATIALGDVDDLQAVRHFGQTIIPALADG